MPLLPQTKQLMTFLHDNPLIRARIAAPPNASLVYCGNFMRPAWQEIEQLRQIYPQVASKRLLPEVLAAIQTPGTPHPTLLAWAKAVEQPWPGNGFIAWRALSGIYAANAKGAVSFYIASQVTKAKVFAATELPVLLRNPNVDAVTKDLLAYYERCLRNGQEAVNAGLIRA